MMQLKIGRRTAKLLKKAGGKGSQTPGRTKGIRATPLQKFMCRSNRSWKRDDYGIVMASLGQRKAKK